MRKMRGERNKIQGKYGENKGSKKNGGKFRLNRGVNGTKKSCRVALPGCPRCHPRCCHFTPALLTQLLPGPIALISALISSTRANKRKRGGKGLENNTWNFDPGIQRHFLIARSCSVPSWVGILLSWEKSGGKERFWHVKPS